MSDKEAFHGEKEYRENEKIDDCPICDQKLDRDDHSSCEGCGKISISTNSEGQGTCIECAVGFYRDAVDSAHIIFKKIAKGRYMDEDIRKAINFYCETHPKMDEEGDPVYVKMDKNGKWVPLF